MEMNCKQVKRKLSSFLDHELSRKQRSAIEEHLGYCVDCRKEKLRLMEVSSLMRSLPEIVPHAQSEAVFWKNVRDAGRPGYWEKMKIMVSRWNVIPLGYPATVVMLLGLAVGLLFNSIYLPERISPPGLRPAAVEYFSLDRMASIPEGSVTGVYLSMAGMRQN